MQFLVCCGYLFDQLDLSNLDLSNCDLSGGKFAQCCFTRSIFKHSLVDEDSIMWNCKSEESSDDTSKAKHPVYSYHEEFTFRAY